jgi:hypothetical protein
MDLMSLTSTGKRLATSIASSEAKSPQIFPCKRRLGVSWSSTRRPRRRSGSICLPRSSRELMRSSSS